MKRGGIGNLDFVHDDAEVEGVGCRRDAVAYLPEVSLEAEGEVGGGPRQCAHEHEREREPDARGVPLPVDDVVADDGDEVGEVLEDGHHRDVEVLESAEGGPDHGDEEDVCWEPHAHDPPRQLLQRAQQPPASRYPGRATGEPGRQHVVKLSCFVTQVPPPPFPPICAPTDEAEAAVFVRSSMQRE